MPSFHTQKVYLCSFRKHPEDIFRWRSTGGFIVSITVDSTDVKLNHGNYVATSIYLKKWVNEFHQPRISICEIFLELGRFLDHVIKIYLKRELYKGKLSGKVLSHHVKVLIRLSTSDFFFYFTQKLTLSLQNSRI